jgi:hypothetical protein
MVTKLLRGRRADRNDADVAGVEGSRQSSNRPALSGRVEAFEEDEQTGRHDRGIQETGGEEAQLGESMLRGLDALLGLFVSE